MALGIIENSIVIFIYYYKFEESSTQVFIVALSVCDFLTCIICIPLEIVLLHFTFTFNNDIACRVIAYTISIAITNSAIIVFLISVDRYILVCRPFKQQISSQTSKKIIISSAICSSIVCIPSIFVYTKESRIVRQCGDIGEECSISPNINGAVYPVAYLIVIFIIFCLVFILLIFLYIQIGKKIVGIYEFKKGIRNSFRVLKRFNSILKYNDDECEDDSLPVNKQKRRHSMNPTRTNFILFIVTFVWFISFFPHFAAVFWQFLTKNFSETATDPEKLANRILICSYYLSGTLNEYV